MRLTIDQKRHLTAVAFGQMRDTERFLTVIREGNATRRNAKVAIVEDLLQRGWIVRTGDLRYQLTEAGRAVLDGASP